MTDKVPRDFTLSIVSHGHDQLLAAFLNDLDAEPDLTGVSVVVTLNVPQAFDAADYPNLAIEVIRNATPKGFGANHNAAFARCQTPWFVILNPDLRLHGGEPFSRLIRRAAKNPATALIAPRIVSEDGAAADAVRPNLTPLSLLRRRLGTNDALIPGKPSRRGEPFYWLAGMCLMIDAAAFRQIGGFDERFFLYCEDYDLSARLYAQGYALVVDQNMSIVHVAQRDSHRRRRHLTWHVTSLIKVWTSTAFWRIVLKIYPSS